MDVETAARDVRGPEVKGGREAPARTHHFHAGCEGTETQTPFVVVNIGKERANLAGQQAGSLLSGLITGGAGASGQTDKDQSADGEEQATSRRSFQSVE